MTQTLQIGTFKNKTAFVERLVTGSPILLDGGLSNQLEAQNMDLNNELWCASLLIENPQEIVKAHKHYLDAGADCVTTASYQASYTGFESVGLSIEESNQLILKSVLLAKEAITNFMAEKTDKQAKPFIAASVGPFGASRADGSEYHGNYGVTDKELADFHRARLMLLDQSEADVLACETIPSFQEVKVLGDLLLQVKTPAWISFSCRDGQSLNDGTAVEHVVKQFIDHPTVVAVGINCTPPQFAEELVARIKQILPNKAVVVYPNSGETYDPTDKSWHGTTSPYACGQASQNWVKNGARIIGGCCRMGPEHIRAMKVLI